jgi:pyruvate dehydrogenase E1 component alpha subunit
VSELSDAIVALRDADARLSELGTTPFHLPVGGLEAVVVGAVLGSGRGDWWSPGLRERVGAVLRGVPVERLVDGFVGARPYKVVPSGSTVALRALRAVGVALAEGRRTVVHLGIGSVSDGAFGEALNLAALTQAPVTFLVAVHPLGDGAPIGPQTAASPSALAAAYGLPTREVDGASALAVRQAVEWARTESGPVLLQATLRPDVDALNVASAEA